MIATVVLSIILTSPFQAIPGALDGPNIQDVPVAWVDTGNDNIANKQQPDDNRTFEFSAGYRIDNHFIFLADYSAFTEKNTTKTRIDEITTALGYIIEDKNFIICPSIGIRLKGNYGGADIQSDFHSLIEPKSQPVTASYERAPNVLLGGLSVEYNKELVRCLFDDTQFVYGISGRLVGAITTSGEVDSAWQILLTMEQTHWYTCYIGIRDEMRSGNTQSITEQQVMTKEKGVYFLMGTSLMDTIYLEWGTSKLFAYGIVGLMQRF